METLFDYYKDHFKCRIHNQKLKQVSAQGHDHTTNNSNHSHTHTHTTTVEASTSQQQFLWEKKST